MKQGIKRILSLILTIAITVGMLPTITIPVIAASRYSLVSNTISGEQIVSEARKWASVDAEYWSGTSPWLPSVYWRTGYTYNGQTSFDCSGFVGRILNDCGFRSSNYTPSYGDCILKEQYGSGYIAISIEDLVNYGTDITDEVQKAKNGDYSGLQPGDIIGWTGNGRHVIIYAGMKNNVPWMVEFTGSGYLDRAVTSSYQSKFENGARFASVPASYLDDCTPYYAHCTIEATANTSAMTLPCSSGTNSDSTAVESIAKGDTYTAIGLILNTAENYWYKIKTSSGEIAYVPSGKMDYVSDITSDLTISSANAPSTITEGNSFSISGKISASYNDLTNVAAYVYSGRTTSGTSVTGGSATVSGQSYSLSGSAVDNKVVFGNLSPGTYTYVVTATITNYYAATEKTRGSNTHTVTLKQSYFTVTEAADDPAQLGATSDSVSLTLGGSESADVTFYWTGSNENNVYLSFNCNNDNVSCSWGSWSNHQIPLTITAYAMGSTTITVDLKDSETDEILDTYILYAYVDAKTYTVSYYSCGEWSCELLSSQTKYHDTDLILSSDVPTKLGSNFDGWSTDDGVMYQPGDVYTANADVDLTACWSGHCLNDGFGIMMLNPDIRYGGVGYYYEYYVEMDGRIRLESGGYSDTIVYVYDSNGSLVGSDDDSGEDRLFFLDFYAEAGETYYIYVKFYDSSETGTLNFYISRPYFIEYDANGGTNTPDNQVKYHGIDKPLTSDIPSRFGYNFVGWSDITYGYGFQPGDTYTRNEDATFSAIWQAAPSLTAFHDSCVHYTPRTNYPGVGTYLRIEPQESGIYSFKSETGSDAIIYLYDANENLLAEDDDSGGNLQFQLDYHLEKGKIYYAYVNYYNGITGDLPLAISPLGNTITYDLNDDLFGGKAVGCPDSQIKYHGTDLTLSTTVPSLFGYNFYGWYTFNESTGDDEEYYPGGIFTRDEDTTLYANWGPPTTAHADAQWYARLDCPGAGEYFNFSPEVSGYYRCMATASSDSIVYLYDSNGNLLASNDDSGGKYQFLLDYYYTAGENYKIYVKFYNNSTTGTLPFYLSSQHTISYDANGGSAAPDRQTAYYGIDTTLSSTIPTRSGYVFLGWSTDSNATAAQYQPGNAFVVNEDVVLYAVWGRAVTQITLDKSKIGLEVSDTYQLTATVIPADANNCTLTWSSSNEDVVTVNANGLITAVGNGTAVITATATDGSGVSASCTVTVTGSAVSLAGKSLSLNGDIGVNFYVSLADKLLADENLRMVFTVGDKTSEVALADALADTQDDGSVWYRFSCAMPAKGMNDTISAQIYGTDGAVGEVMTYSVAQYYTDICQQFDREEKAALFDMIEDMLNYGAAAQEYFDYNTENPANAAVNTAAPETVDASAFADNVTDTDALLDYAGASLVLESNTSLRVFFRPASGADLSGYSFTVNGAAVTPVQRGNLWYVELSNIAAKDLDETHTFTAGDVTVECSALSYVNNVVNKTDSLDTELVAVGKALYAYNEAANAYFQPSSNDIVTVTYYSSVGSYLGTLQEEIDKWNAGAGKEAGVYIQLESNISTYSTDLESMMLAGTHYDIIDAGTGNDHWKLNGWVQDLNAIDDPELKALISSYEQYFVPGINTDYGLDGKRFLHSLPLEVVPLKMAVNLDLFEQAGCELPETWEDVVAAAEKISALGDNIYGYGGTTWSAYYTRLHMLTAGNSLHPYWDPNTETYSFSQYEEIVMSLKTMYSNGWIMGLDDLSIDPIRAEFAAGNVGMFPSPSYDFAVYTTQFPAQCNWAVIDMPVASNGGDYKGLYMDRVGCAIDAVSYEAADAAKKAAIVKAFCFLNSDELASVLYANGMLIPYKYEVIANTEVLIDHPQWAQYADIENYMSVPQIPDGILSLEGDRIHDVINAVVHGELDWDTGIANAEAYYNAAYQAAKADPDIDTSIYAYEYNH